MRLPDSLKQLDLAHVAVLGAAVATLVVFQFSPAVFTDGDTYWHIVTGRWIVEHGQIPRGDPFSFSVPGRAWQAHEWLADILMYGAYRLGGWTGITLFFGVVAAAGSAALAWRVSRSLGGVALLVLVALSLAITTGSLLARPHMLILPLIVVWTIQMMDAREKDRAPPLALAALMVLWANLHASYALAFVIAGAFGLEALWEAPKERRLKVFRDWMLFGLLSVLAVTLTPFGVSGLLFPFKLMNLSILHTIDEWLPVDFGKFGLFQFSLFLALFVLLTRGARIKPMRMLLLLALLYMALQHVRQLAVLGVVAPLLLAAPLACALQQKQKGPASDWRAPALAFAALAGVVIALRSFHPVVRTDSPVSPMTAVRHVPATLAQQPVLNDYGVGGYLIFAGVKPYIDGRADMYGDKFVADYMQLFRNPRPEEVRRVLETNHIAWTIFKPGDLVTGAMDRQPGWRRLYADKWAVVHIRTDPTAQLRP